MDDSLWGALQNKRKTEVWQVFYSFACLLAMLICCQKSDLFCEKLRVDTIPGIHESRFVWGKAHIAFHIFRLIGA